MAAGTPPAATDRANTRTDRANTRTDRAKTHTDHAITRTDRANAHTDHANPSTDRATTRTERRGFSPGENAPVTARRKPTFKEQREFESLPATIEALEAEQARLTAAVSAPDFYKQPPADIQRALAELEILPKKLEDAYARWDELDGRVSGRVLP
jgi:hypothetical protein